MMKKVYGDDCLSRSRIHEWFKRFQEGREALEDDRAGQEMLGTKKTRQLCMNSSEKKSSKSSLKYMESALAPSAVSIYR